MVAGLTMLGVGMPKHKGVSVLGFYSVVVVGGGTSHHLHIKFHM